jgi:hypothetical protein
VRENNLDLLDSVPKNLWENYGMHQERGKETIAHIVRMLAGHDLKHLGQVEKIAKESSEAMGAAVHPFGSAAAPPGFVRGS